MRRNGGNENAISAFILKFSRKLRDRYLPGLAEVKVTRETTFFVGVCVCWADFLGRIALQLHLHGSEQR